MKKFLLGIIVFEACILYFILPYIQDDYAYSLVFTGINICTIMFLLPNMDIPYWLYRYIFIIYGLKFIVFCVMYNNISVYMSIFKIWDVNIFYQPEALAYLHGYTEGVQFYSKLVACIYYLFGAVMEIPVFFNIMISMFADILFYKVLRNNDLSLRSMKLFLLIFMLLPWRNLQSLYMLREAIPTFLVVVVIFYLQKFLFYEKNRYVVQAMFFSAVAMLFHSGLLALAVVTLFMVIFYNSEEAAFQMKKSNIYRGLVVVALLGLMIVVAGDSLFYKFILIFGKDETAVAAWAAAVADNAGSVYLQGLQYTSIVDIVWQAPIRLVYFLISPMPWDWRNIKDIGAFCFDSMVHMIGVVYLLRNFSAVSGRTRVFVKVVFLMYLFAALTFGAGTFDSGTAMRHRAKITSMIIICMAMVYDYKKKYGLSRGER